MKLIKTAKAREALSDRSSLSMSQRRILILCDGKRSRQEIVGWLGSDAMSMMDGLFADGYLALANAPSKQVPAASVAPTESTPTAAATLGQLSSASPSV